MPDFASPAWLLALAGIALIRWLHRFRTASASVLVPALHLWPHAAGESDAGRHRERPDPAWRLRAAIAAAVAVALSGPYWASTRPLALTLWIDDSPSMQAVESGRRRIDAGLAAALTAARAAGHTEITLRSLADPAASLALDAEDRPDSAAVAIWLAEPRGAPAPPAPVLMAGDTIHWALTDGADRSLDQWLANPRLAKIVQIGTATENVALLRLAISPAPEGDGTSIAFVRLRNFGRQPAHRTLRLQSNGTLLAETAVTLPPDAEHRLQIALQNGSADLMASIAPGDALARDDRLVLAAERAWPLAVVVAAGCDRRLGMAIAAHPRLRLAGAGEGAALSLHCGPPAAPPNAPATIVFDAGDEPQRLSAPVHRATDAAARDWPMLEAAWLKAGDRPLQGRVVLQAGTRPLVAVRRQAGHSVVDVAFDPSAGDLPTRAAFPRLIGALADEGLGIRLQAPAAIALPADESKIAPGPLPSAPLATPSARAGVTDASWLALALATVLFTFDLLRVARHRRPAPGADGFRR